MNKVHPAFHVSKLKKAIEDPEQPLKVSQIGSVYEFGDSSRFYIAEELVQIVQMTSVEGRTVFKVKQDWPCCNWETAFCRLY